MKLVLKKLLVGAHPRGADAVALRDGDFAQFLRNFGRGDRDAPPILSLQREAHLAAEIPSPVPLHAEAVGFDPVIALLPGLHRHIDRLRNLLQRQGDERRQVVGGVVRLGLLHQFSDRHYHRAGKVVAQFTRAFRVDDTAQMEFLPKVSKWLKQVDYKLYNPELAEKERIQA